ncbi:hypothetical protein NIES25_54780 (plasmid) [Nostoc linckia NIES-25]|nr:hypothetical protein NIES25_54780 [Nostoc linckia NIES-25]
MTVPLVKAIARNYSRLQLDEVQIIVKAQYIVPLPVYLCVEPMTFDKMRLIQQLGELEAELLEQAQSILRQYLKLQAKYC